MMMMMTSHIVIAIGLYIQFALPFCYNVVVYILLTFVLLCINSFDFVTSVFTLGLFVAYANLRCVVMQIVTAEYARDSLQSELEDWKPKRVSKGKCCEI